MEEYFDRLMKIHELNKRLKELAEVQRDGKVVLVEDAKRGPQWPSLPVTEVRRATPGEKQRAGNKSGIAMAVITTG